MLCDWTECSRQKAAYIAAVAGSVKVEAATHQVAGGTHVTGGVAGLAALPGPAYKSI